MDKKLIDQWWALRENKSNKIKYHLIPLDQRKRLAIHYTEGAKLHGDRNWESGNIEYTNKCKESALRHMTQRLAGEVDEDHAMAIVRNIFAYEHLKERNDNIDIQKLMDNIFNNF